jgi:hypothetical protein
LPASKLSNKPKAAPIWAAFLFAQLVDYFQTKEYKGFMNRSYVTFTIIATIVVLFGLIFYINSRKSADTTGEPEYAVVIKPNTEDKASADIFLVDPATQTETFFLTTTNVATHYHVAEYRNGNVYLIKRTGEDLADFKNENWTDEIWKYDAEKNGTKLFAAKGMDFRASPDGKTIAAFYMDLNTERIEDGWTIAVSFLNDKGRRIKTLTAADLGTEKYEAYVSPIFFAGDQLWFSAGSGPKIDVFGKIDTSHKFAMTKFDVAEEMVQIGEFSLNPDREMIALSDFPFIFDVDSAKEFTASKKTVTLSTYNLVTKEKETVATSVAKAFAPVWLDPQTLEYNDPNAEARVMKVID